MSVAGTYECVTKTPMGDQKSDMTITVDGDTFTGTNAGAMGSMSMDNGKVDGNTLTWSMNMTVPMPMTLEGPGFNTAKLTSNYLDNSADTPAMEAGDEAD